MRIKWNRQLDGSLTNRPADGSDMPNDDDTQKDIKSHTTPKFFKIFRRKKRRQVDQNSESQAPSEVDESDCASISSIATVASQPSTEVCHRDRTLSLFSSFRLSLPGGRKKSKPSVPPLFQAEENNRYSSPDLRREKLDCSNEPISKSVSSFGKNSGDFDSLLTDTQSLRGETSKSFAALKSDSVNVQPKLPKSVSFSDCQTKRGAVRNNEMLTQSQSEEGTKRKKIGFFKNRSGSYRLPKNSAVCPSDVKLLAHTDYDVDTKTDANSIVQCVNESSKLIVENKTLSLSFEKCDGNAEIKSQVISDAKKNYFRHRASHKDEESTHVQNIVASHNPVNKYTEIQDEHKLKESISRSSCTDSVKFSLEEKDQNRSLPENVTYLEHDFNENITLVVPFIKCTQETVLLDKDDSECLPNNNCNSSSDVHISEECAPETFDKIMDSLERISKSVQDTRVTVQTSISSEISDSDITKKNISPNNLCAKNEIFFDGDLEESQLMDTYCTPESEKQVSHELISNHSFKHVSHQNCSDLNSNRFDQLSLENQNAFPFEAYQQIYRRIHTNPSVPNFYLDYLNCNDSLLFKPYLAKPELNYYLDSLNSPNHEGNFPKFDRLDALIENNIRKKLNMPLQSINETASVLLHCETSDFDAVCDAYSTDRRYFPTRVKNQDRCPSYYSMSVGPAALPITGVTVAGSDLLQGIDDTPQLSENKGGSFSTDIGCCSGQFSEMLSTFEAPFGICDEMTEEKASYSEDKCKDDSIYNGSDKGSSESSGVEFSTEDYSATPLPSENSDYFSMHEEHCFADECPVSTHNSEEVDHCIHSEIQVNDVTVNENSGKTSVVDAPSFLFDLPTSPEESVCFNETAIEKDERIDCENESHKEKSSFAFKNTEFHRDDVNECKNLSNCRKNSSDKISLSFIPSLKRNGTKLTKKTLPLNRKKERSSSLTNTETLVLSRDFKKLKVLEAHITNGNFMEEAISEVKRCEASDKLSKQGAVEVITVCDTLGNLDTNQFNPEEIVSTNTEQECPTVKSNAIDCSKSFCATSSRRSSNATLDETSLSEIYSAPLHRGVNFQKLQSRCVSLPAVVGQSPHKDLCPFRNKDTPIKKSRIPKKQTGVRSVVSKPVRPPMWLSKAELTQEIQRLGTLCETRTKELNRLKMETKHVSIGFDAFAALFKYMVDDLNGLSVPVLSNDLQKTLKQLELAKQDLAYYEREVEEMKAHHSQELNDLSNKLFEVYQGELTELSAKHQEELNNLNLDHQQQIENLSKNLQATSDEKHSKQEQLITELKQELITQREELQLYQEREIKDVEEKHALATKTLQEHIEQLQKKCAELNQHSMSMEDAMRKDTDSKLQWVTSRKIDLEKEVESLKTVLEMKNKELHSLRIQTLEMEKQLEDLPLAREKIKMLQARAEDLEALMIEKTNLERKLCTENQLVKDSYEKENKINKRLSMENEELQWRLRQAENSLLSGSFAEVSEYPDDDVENEASSPVKTSPAPQMSRSVFFTFVDKDNSSPRSQYKKITPGFAASYRASPGRTQKSSSAPSPRRSKSHSEPPQPPTTLCTPRKVIKQASKRSRSGSDSGRPATQHTEVTFSSVTGSMTSSVSSESSVFGNKEQLLEEHEEQIMETLQILREQRSVESPTLSNSENEESKESSMSPDFGTEDLSRSSEFSDPKTYYHMTFPVPKEAGMIVYCDNEETGKRSTSEETTPSVEEPTKIAHSTENNENAVSKDLNSVSEGSPENPEFNTLSEVSVSANSIQSTDSHSTNGAHDQLRTI